MEGGVGDGGVGGGPGEPTQNSHESLQFSVMYAKNWLVAAQNPLSAQLPHCDVGWMSRHPPTGGGGVDVVFDQSWQDLHGVRVRACVHTCVCMSAFVRTTVR